MKGFSRVLLFVLGILFFPLVAAQRYGGGSFRSSSFIEAIANNEYIRLALIFVFFYMVLFYSLKKAFKDQRGAAAGIAAVVALFITFTVVRRNLLYNFVGDELGTWILFFVFLIAAVFLVRIAHKNLGAFGTIIIVWILWISAWVYDITPLVPFSDVGDIILDIYYTVTGVGGFLVLVILTIIFIIVRIKKGKKSMGEKIAKALSQK